MILLTYSVIAANVAMICYGGYCVFAGKSKLGLVPEAPRPEAATIEKDFLTHLIEDYKVSNESRQYNLELARLRKELDEAIR